MRKIGLLLIFLSSITSHAALAATDSEIIAEMAGKCWQLPDDINYQTARAVFEVKYDAEGKLTDIATLDYRPVRKAGQLFAISAIEAIQTCAAQSHVRSRTLRIVMNYSGERANDPLNMKRR